jgi:type IV pilus assembly protein PilC
MPEFMCRVATPAGEVFERSYVADDEAALRRDLDNQDLMVLDFRRRSPLLQQLAKTFRIKGNVSGREFLLFNQELSALVRAGLPIVPSLDILLERRKNESFKRALVDVRDRVKSGESLSEAFTAQGDMFPPLYSASLASGERSGELANVLQRFIAYSQKLLSIQRKVVSALIYPIILLVLSSGLVALMVFYIIPRFNEFLKDFGAELPLITKIIVGTAMTLAGNWQIVLLIVVGSVVGVMAWSRTLGGRLFFDRMKLRLPLVGGVVRNYAQNRFTRTLGTLQAGGIPMVTSLELSARAVGNLVYERELVKVAANVREGKSLWESLLETGLIADITVQMIKVGESTGMLVEMLQNASDFTDEEIDTQLTRLVSMIEPLMLVFMALVVATMLLSIYLPMIQAYGGTRGI